MKEERFEQILQILNTKSFVSNRELTEKTGIPLSTLRRDLSELEAAGRLVKHRGGVSAGMDTEARKTAHEAPFELRGQENAEEKMRIARAALQFIQPHDTIIIDGGTTTYALAKNLPSGVDLMVTTNDLRAAMALADNPNINLIVAGGKARSSYYTLVGMFSEHILAQIHADTAFISADAVDLAHGLMSFSLEEVSIKQCMVRAAREVIVLCDHTKFSAVAFLKFAGLEEVDTIITGKELNKTVADSLRDMGITVILV